MRFSAVGVVVTCLPSTQTLWVRFPDGAFSPLAQGLERIISNDEVDGSNPSGGIKEKKVIDP